MPHEIKLPPIDELPSLTESHGRWTTVAAIRFAEDYARAAVALNLAGRASTPAVGAGWRLVPVEPTPEILAAMYKTMARDRVPLTWEVDMYAAILSAAPPAPAEPDYAAMELEHLGDPAKQTGVYAQQPAPAVQAEQISRARLLEILCNLDSSAVRLPSGFEKFARAVEAEVRATPQAPLPTPPQGEDAARYRWLREHRVIDLYSNPSVPWVVRCEFQPIPVTTPIFGAALDAAIDAARATQAQEKKV